MQDKVIKTLSHKNLVRYFVMALIDEDPAKTQRAGLIGLPGLYKSVQGTTDYKTDTFQFMLVEEDHLKPLDPRFFDQEPDSTLLSKFTLKQFLDRVLPNPVLVDLFEDKTILY